MAASPSESLIGRICVIVLIFIKKVSDSVVTFTKLPTFIALITFKVSSPSHVVLIMYGFFSTLFGGIIKTKKINMKDGRSENFAVIANLSEIKTEPKDNIIVMDNIPNLKKL